VEPETWDSWPERMHLGIQSRALQKYFYFQLLKVEIGDLHMRTQRRRYTKSKDDMKIRIFWNEGASRPHRRLAEEHY
jgi:hypothetical protein